MLPWNGAVDKLANVFYVAGNRRIGARTMVFHKKLVERLTSNLGLAFLRARTESTHFLAADLSHAFSITMMIILPLTNRFNAFDFLKSQ